MKLNGEYLKTTAIAMVVVLWAIAVVAFFVAFIGAILSANVAGVIGVLIIGAVFTYFTCMAVDKLDL